MKFRDYAELDQHTEMQLVCQAISWWKTPEKLILAMIDRIIIMFSCTWRYVNMEDGEHENTMVNLFPTIKIEFAGALHQDMNRQARYILICSSILPTHRTLLCSDYCLFLSPKNFLYQITENTGLWPFITLYHPLFLF